MGNSIFGKEFKEEKKYKFCKEAYKADAKAEGYAVLPWCELVDGREVIERVVVPCLGGEMWLGKLAGDYIVSADWCVEIEEIEEKETLEGETV